MKKIALSFSNGIGNFIMVIPTIKALQELGYTVDISLDMLETDPRKKEIESLIDTWDEVNIVDFKNEYEHYFIIWGDQRTLNPTILWKTIQVDFINWVKQGNHEVDLNMLLPRYLGWDKEKAPSLELPQFKHIKKCTGNNIAIHIGSRPEEVWQKKRWPLGYWKSLFKKLSTHFSGNVIFHILSGEWEKEDVHELTKIPFASFEILDNFNLAELAEYLKENTRLLVTTDSGPMHLAGALNLDVIRLFGPTLKSKNDIWRYSEKGFLQSDRDCCPCLYTHRFVDCKDNKCMKDLTPHLVFMEVLKFLEKEK